MLQQLTSLRALWSLTLLLFSLLIHCFIFPSFSLFPPFVHCSPICHNYGAKHWLSCPCLSPCSFIPLHEYHHHHHSQTPASLWFSPQQAICFLWFSQQPAQKHQCGTGSCFFSLEIFTISQLSLFSVAVLNWKQHFLLI